MDRPGTDWGYAAQAQLSREGWSSVSMDAIRNLLQPASKSLIADGDALKGIKQLAEKFVPGLSSPKDHRDDETEHKTFKVCNVPAWCTVLWAM